VRILLASTHRYPAEDYRETGLEPREEPSSAPAQLNDLLARGLGELGHEVLYHLPDGASQPLPSGVRLVSEPVMDVDIVHDFPSDCRPWVKTQHRADTPSAARDNWIFVSQSLAHRHERTRYVYSGLDPSDFRYAETKGDYFFYISSGQGNRVRYNFMAKGMGLALRLCAETGSKLIVAGTARDRAVVYRMSELCRTYGAQFVGDVRGAHKADLFAGARAVIFPTFFFEGLPLVLIEALMSGTPVICSDRGPCPEVITPEVGFACHDRQQYLAAVAGIGTISPRACRQRAMEKFHYLRMAQDYVREYQTEIDAWNERMKSRAHQA
jgi:glycosyltransferase involved in cell wall biosynthesis